MGVVIVGEVVGGGRDGVDSRECGEVLTGLIAGGVGVVDGEDLFVAGKG